MDILVAKILKAHQSSSQPNIYEAQSLILGKHGGGEPNSLEIKRHTVLVSVLLLLRDTMTTATLVKESI